MEVGDGALGCGGTSPWPPPQPAPGDLTGGCAVPPRYDLQIRYLPEDYMERFTEDRTTLLYFYQQVWGGPPAPGASPPPHQNPPHGPMAINSLPRPGSGCRSAWTLGDAGGLPSTP